MILFLFFIYCYVGVLITNTILFPSSSCRYASNALVYVGTSISSTSHLLLHSDTQLYQILRPTAIGKKPSGNCRLRSVHTSYKTAATITLWKEKCKNHELLRRFRLFTLAKPTGFLTSCMWRLSQGFSGKIDMRTCRVLLSSWLATRESDQNRGCSVFAGCNN